MKRPFRAKSVADSLSTPEGVLKQLLEKANSLKSLTQLLQKLLPAELKAHCSVTELNANVLTINAESAAWGTRLRYIQSQLLADLRANGYPSLISIQINISPTSTINQ